MFGKQLTSLIFGKAMAPGKAAHLRVGGFVRHAALTNQTGSAFRQMSFLIVASAPPSISHLAPLT